jgi:hypothetical protein
MQSAYRTNHSCESALLRVHNDIAASLAERKVAALVLLDMSAAFDTVLHQILLHILERYGIRGPALEWFRSYLEKREQCVTVNGTKSNIRSVPCGVPQGSVLGPLLFTIYTIGLGQIIRQHNVNFHFYADDIQLYVSTDRDDLLNAIIRLENCIADVRNWLCAHQLKLNEAKTEFMIITPKSTPPIHDIHLRISDVTIEPAERLRNLGVFMDNNFRMEHQINQICRSSYGQLRAIRRMKDYLDRQTLEILMHAFITSKLDYCNSLLSGVPQHLLSKLQKVQNAAARILTETPMHAHITPVLKELHWLPVAARIDFKVLMFVFKCVSNCGPQYLCDILTRYTQPRLLRSNQMTLLNIPLINNRYANQCFSVYGPKLWNVLPNELQQTTDFNTFKSMLKTYLFTIHFN